MATAQVRIKDRKFVDYSGRYLEYLEPDDMSGNGWECWFNYDGTLICESAREYSDGQHMMRYEIHPNGFAKQTLTIGSETKIIKQGFVTPKGVKFNTGLLGLSGGYIDKRYAYFRYETLQEFLDQYKITAISRQDPNKKYKVRSAHYGGGQASYSFWTDGIQKDKQYDFGRTEEWEREFPGTSAQEADITINVEDATWVVVDQSVQENSRACHSRILYTTMSEILELDLSPVLGNGG